MPDLTYDFVAVGGGTAGLVAARGAHHLGARAAIVERTALGGDCLWTGCVPSKALIASADAAAAMTRADRLGLEAADPGHDFAAVKTRLERARARIAERDDPDRLRELGVAVHEGHGRFVAPGVLEVDGVGRVRSSRFLIATGARPAVPSIEGLESADFLTHETIFDLGALPRSLLVVGGGPVGLELAQAFARLGSAVTVVEREDRVLSREDPRASRIVRSALEDDGVDVRTGCLLESVSESREGGVATTSDGDRLAYDKLLVATGRRPWFGDLSPETAGVRLQGGSLEVDKRLRAAKGVWLAGDVTGGPQYTHAAAYMAAKVVRNALLPFSSDVNLDVVPRVTFTDPGVAHVGAVAHVEAAHTFSFDLADLDRAILEDETRGFVKVHASRSGRVLGATVVARGAGDLIQPFVLAMKHGVRLGGIASTVFPYPTRVEAVHHASMAFARAKLDTRAGRLLKRLVRLLT